MSEMSKLILWSFHVQRNVFLKNVCIAKKTMPKSLTQAEDFCRERAAPHNRSETRSRNSASTSENDKEKIIQATRKLSTLKGLDDVVGLQGVKSVLRQALKLPHLHPHLFTGGRRPWSSVLLYGPPGTGKTRLAHAVAAEVNAELYCVSSAELLSSWVGESEKIIQELFQYMNNRNTIKVVFLDEIDSLCRQRSSNEEDLTRRIKTQLLTAMGDCDNSGSIKTFLIGATNCPWEIDSAFLRRFQKKLYIPLPDRQSRQNIIKAHCRGNNVSLTDNEWEVLGISTDGYSGSDLANLAKEALFEPINELDCSNFWKENEGGRMVPCTRNFEGAVHKFLEDLRPEQVEARDVSFSDFKMALTNSKRTVTNEDIERYESFTVQFGQVR
ncbi:unnamed protein product [Timema podura]|uniref:AAA+ ATPase domain-containing protein n=1 Tax=Timema podura TaxID=61482 RepID=A0ABN7NTT8_TIMPD|nr:unnamed protein product [Timema podura]